MADNELMLTDRLKNNPFQLQVRQNEASSRGGKAHVVEFGLPFWVASFRYENLQGASYRALSAWIQRRNGAMSPFTGFPASRRNPANHSAGGSNAGLVLSGYNSTTGAITINKGNMAVGDFVSWDATDGSKFLGEIIEVTAVSGSSTTFKTAPFAAQPHATENAKVFDPVASFRMIPSSLRIDDRADDIYSVSFDARQKED